MRREKIGRSRSQSKRRNSRASSNGPAYPKEKDTDLALSRCAMLLDHIPNAQTIRPLARQAGNTIMFDHRHGQHIFGVLNPGPNALRRGQIRGAGEGLTGTAPVASSGTGPWLP